MKATHMRYRKSPQEKKRLSYEKDHILRAENPHRFRKAWPKKKRRANQKDRRKVRQALSTLPETLEDKRSEMPLRPFRRDTVRKWNGSSLPLGKALTQKRQYRLQTTARNFFKRSYVPHLHRERFRAFLAEVTQTDTPSAKELARLFQELLDPPELLAHAIFATYKDPRVRWLAAFLKDNPDWVTPLHRWVAICCT